MFSVKQMPELGNVSEHVYLLRYRVLTTYEASLYCKMNSSRAEVRLKLAAQDRRFVSRSMAQACVYLLTATCLVNRVSTGRRYFGIFKVYRNQHRESARQARERRHLEQPVAWLRSAKPETIVKLQTNTLGNAMTTSLRVFPSAQARPKRRRSCEGEVYGASRSERRSTAAVVPGWAK